MLPSIIFGIQTYHIVVGALCVGLLYVFFVGLFLPCINPQDEVTDKEQGEHE